MLRRETFNSHMQSFRLFFSWYLNRNGISRDCEKKTMSSELQRSKQLTSHDRSHSHHRPFLLCLHFDQKTFQRDKTHCTFFDIEKIFEGREVIGFSKFKKKDISFSIKKRLRKECEVLDKSQENNLHSFSWGMITYIPQLCNQTTSFPVQIYCCLEMNFCSEINHNKRSDKLRLNEIEWYEFFSFFCIVINWWGIEQLGFVIYF